MESLDMECPRLSQAAQHPVCFFNNVCREVIVERVENAAWRLRLPVVSFELVTGMTAVHPVSRVVSATVRVRLKVVNGQGCTDIHFTRAAVPAAKLIQTT
jgi:hypothetical protein